MLHIFKRCGSRPEGVIELLSYNGLLRRRFPPVINKVLAYSSQCASRGSDSKSRNRITYKPYLPPPKMVDHDYKNMNLKRPMSPHLTIFKMTTPAAMSIFQRITGCTLALYALLLAGGTLFLSNGVETYVSIIQSSELSQFTIIILKVILGFPFAYHYFNGIRFCMWNIGRWLTMKEVDSTAKQAVIACIVLTALFAIL